MTTAPFGSWPSPIAASDVAAHSHPVLSAHYLGEQVFLTERAGSPRPRVSALRLSSPEGGEAHAEPLVGPDVAIGSRVHEYGGGASAVAASGDDGWQFFYVEHESQRVFRVTNAAPRPVALTPEGGVRHGDLTVHGDDLWLVTESHTRSGIRRAIARIPGAAAPDPREPAPAEVVVGGTDFLAWPRVSPDGRLLAWVGWDHPRMPWDGTTLFVMPLDGSGEPRALAGGDDESVLQPEWAGASTLMFLSDRSGYWNPYSLDVSQALSRSSGGAAMLERGAPLDMGGPLWTLGQRWFALLGGGGRMVCEQRYGTSELVWLNRYSHDDTVLETGLDAFSLLDVREDRDGPRALLLGRGRHRASGLYEFRLASGELVPLRLDDDETPPSDYLPEAEMHTFTAPYERGGRDVHAIVYPPRHPDHEGPPGQRPPYVAFVHGGPTAQSVPGISPHHAFFTSRGIGVVDVNYGGSSGYGREYRERLRGQWGVVDVEDTVTAMRGLVDLGYADPARLVISGGSAGGWTVLSALTHDDTFAAGASYYGVGELLEFVKETHDFESHYVDGLVGPLPEAEDLYLTRAPLNNLERLSAPVVLFQGLKDPVVPPAQAERIREGLAYAGLVHAVVTYPEEAHGFRAPEAIADSLGKELSFYGQVLGFQTPGVPPLRLTRPR